MGYPLGAPKCACRRSCKNCHWAALGDRLSEPSFRAITLRECAMGRFGVPSPLMTSRITLSDHLFESSSTTRTNHVLTASRMMYPFQFRTCRASRSALHSLILALPHRIDAVAADNPVSIVPTSAPVVTQLTQSSQCFDSLRNASNRWLGDNRERSCGHHL